MRCSIFSSAFSINFFRGNTLIKTVTLLTRRPDLSSEEFHRHWKDIHAPLVLALPGVCRYVQCRPIQVPGREPQYDGIAEVWYEDIESLNATLQTSEYEILLNDEKNFMGSMTKDSIFMFVEEEEFPV